MTYHRPPDWYEPPTICEDCHELIMFGPVIGGNKWSHVAWADHHVVMRDIGWWDVEIGEWRFDNADGQLARALAE